MSEPTVTIKFTETELKTLNQMIKHHPDSVIPQHKRVLKSELNLLNEMIGHHISVWEEKEQLPSYKYQLQDELLKIETWIEDEKHKAITDKKASEGSFKEQTQMETSQRICVPCED